MRASLHFNDQLVYLLRTFSLNPGRIDPNNTAWLNSRKPLAAVWESVLPGSKGQRFFTVNLHLTSKDGSSSTEGNSRPPVNLGVDQRTAQVTEVAVSSFSESSLGGLRLNLD